MIRWIKNWWNGLCPKHGVAYHYHGYGDEPYCPVCTQESREKRRQIINRNE